MTENEKETHKLEEKHEKEDIPMVIVANVIEAGLENGFRIHISSNELKFVDLYAYFLAIKKEILETEAKEKEKTGENHIVG